MAATVKTNLHKRAQDIMARDLVIIPCKMSVSTAAKLLCQAKVSGAPVVDAFGKCVGVISSSDFVRLADGKPHRIGDSGFHPREMHTAWQICEGSPEAAMLVEEVMNLSPLTASPSTSLEQLAKMLSEARVHRVIIVDDIGHPVGLVSSNDLLAAIAENR